MERPGGNPSFPPKTNNHKHSSFCSHLRPKPTNDEDINGCAAAVDDSDQISVFDAENYFNESSGEQQQQKENKISTTLSPAERFGFSTASRVSSVSSSTDGYGRNYRAHSFYATPTDSSEASWNSQTGLLSNPPGSIGVALRNLPSSHGDDQRKKKGTGSRKWFMGGKCPCSGKKSVRVVEEKISDSLTQSVSNRKKMSESLKSEEIKGSTDKVIPKFPPLILSSSQNHFASSINHHRYDPLPNSHRLGFGLFKDGGGFSFPVLNQSSKLALKGASVGPLEDLPRDSLEVFQPQDELTVSRKSMEVQQRPTPTPTPTPTPPLAGVDRDPRIFMFPVTPVVSRVTATDDDDDVVSDASSDLFEIESFSTHPTSSYPMNRRRDSLDEASTLNAIRRPNGTLCCRHSLDEIATPSVAATECYEPSEASIEWSVTTAEGFDRASVTNFSISASEIEYVRRLDESGGGGGGAGRHEGGGGGGDDGRNKRRSSMGNGLLSCRWEKAVSVGPQPVKYCIQQEEEELKGPVVGGPPLSIPLPSISRIRHVK